MKKNLMSTLSVLLTICGVIALFSITVAASPIYEIECDKDSPASGDGWSWDNTKQILTLSGVKIDSECGGIKFSCNATIFLEPGTSSSISAGYSMLCCDDWISGIVPNLTIAGEGDLVLNHNSDSPYAGDNRIVLSNLTINGGNVVLYDCYLRVSRLSLTGGALTINVTDDIAVSAEMVDISGGILTASSSFGADDYIQSGGTVNMNGMRSGNCCVTGGTLNVSTKDDDFTFYVEKTLTLKDCNILFEGNPANPYPEYVTAKNILIDNSNITLTGTTLRAFDDSVQSKTAELITLANVSGIDSSEIIVFDDDYEDEEDPSFSGHLHEELIEGPRTISAMNTGGLPRLSITEVTDTSLTVKALDCGDVSGGKFILVVYNPNGALKEVVFKDFAEETVFDGLDLTGCSVKAMLWDSVDGMHPLAKAAEQ